MISKTPTPMSAAEIADHIEIRQFSQRYAEAIDTLRFDWLDAMFLPGAAMDYELEGHSFSVPYPDVVEASFRPALESCKWTCHLLSEPLIQLRGETASTVTRVIATHIQVHDDGSRTTFVTTGMYFDALKKTAEGWRITARRAVFPSVQGSFFPAGVKRYDASRRAAGG